MSQMTRYQQLPMMLIKGLISDGDTTTEAADYRTNAHDGLWDKAEGENDLHLLQDSGLDEETLLYLLSARWDMILFFLPTELNVTNISCRVVKNSEIFWVRLLLAFY